MPFKHNAAHRCHIPQARYRVTNSLTGVSKTWGSLLALGGLIGLADA